MSTTICWIKKEFHNDEYGYTVKTRLGKPARHFNTPASGIDSNRLLAHDITHHCFAELEDGNKDYRV